MRGLFSVSGTGSGGLRPVRRSRRPFGSTTDMACNGDGLRASQTVGGNGVSYTWDMNAGLPVILQHSLDNTYVYGLDLISRTDGSGNQEYNLYDGLGSTIDVMDGAGDWLAGYVYDAFGSIRFQGGSSANEWLFTGEQRDSDTGMYYLRARYYDPAAGRFLTQDPFVGSAMAPQSLNRYPYVLNNPLRWLDPWGLRNVEGTPTPTPWAGYMPCGPVGPGPGCPNAHYLNPSSGRGIWGTVGDFAGEAWGAYWKYSPNGLTYRYVMSPAWDFASASSNWFMNTCAGQATRLGVGVTSVVAGGILAGSGQEYGLALIPLGIAIANPGPPSPLLESCW